MVLAECCWSTSAYIFGGCFLLYLTKKYFVGGICRSNNRIDGKTVIITGANCGIGKETALDLAKRGGRVILACRDMKKGQEAAKDVIQESGNTNVYLKKLDLASLASVRAFAEDVLKTESRLDILINNAGITSMSYNTTEDGFEMVFGVNHLGHFLLTNLLLDLLKKSSPSRIINVSSNSHRHVKQNIDFEGINKKDNFRSIMSYARSKLANILFSRQLAQRLEGTNVTAYSLNPGVVHTEICHRHIFSSIMIWLLYPLVFIFLKSSKQGAQTTIHLAVADDVEKHNGLYFADCAVSKIRTKVGEDDGMAKKLWEVSADMVGL